MTTSISLCESGRPLVVSKLMCVSPPAVSNPRLFRSGGDAASAEYLKSTFSPLRATAKLLTMVSFLAGVLPVFVKPTEMRTGCPTSSLLAFTSLIPIHARRSSRDTACIALIWASDAPANRLAASALALVLLAILCRFLAWFFEASTRSVSLGGPSLHLVQLIPHNRRLAKKDGTSDHRNKNSSFRQPNHSSLKA